MKVDVVQAKPEHAEAISKICSEGWLQTVAGKYEKEYEIETISKWYNTDKVRCDIKEGIYKYVAIIDGIVVGTIGGVLNNKNESEIYVFYIDDNYRYQGIGKDLLSSFTDEHAKEGATKQRVSVEKDNELGLPFYKARGYKKNSNDGRYYREI